MNEIWTLDDVFQVFGSTEDEHGFLDIESVIKDDLSPQYVHGVRCYCQFFITLSSETVKHTRRTYSFWDLTGDLGGTMEVAIVFFTFLISPWAEFQFYLKAMQKIYNVKTKKINEFRVSKAKKYSAKYLKKMETLKD